MSCGGASGSENSSNYAVRGSENSEDESVYLTVKLFTLSGVELATVQVDKDATIGQLVAKMKMQPSLLEVDCCCIVLCDDPDNNVHGLGTYDCVFFKFTLTAWCSNRSVVRCQMIQSAEPKK